MLCLLKFSQSVVAGGSMLWCLRPFEDVYQGDLDLYMEFDIKGRRFNTDAKQLYDREKLVDVFVQSWGYVSTDDQSAVKKPSLCPSCYSSDNLFPVKPCGHWLCKHCAAELGHYKSTIKCPQCQGDCTNIVKVYPRVYPRDREEYKNVSGIKYFKEYRHSGTNRVIQLIVVHDVQEVIHTSFDLTCCKVWMGPDSWVQSRKPDWDLTSEGLAELRPDAIYDDKVHSRVCKYASRGFLVRLMKGQHIQDYVTRVGAWLLPDVLWTLVVCKFLE